MKNLSLSIFLIASVLLGFAHAYTGPGLGAATIAIVVGVFTSIFVALFAVIWYPIKRALKRGKQNNSPASKNDDIAQTASEDSGDGNSN